MKNILNSFKDFGNNFRLRKFRIFENAYYWMILPLAIIFIALVFGTVYATTSTAGFANVGVDFRGGTVLTVEMTGADMVNANYDDNVTMVTEIIESYGGSISTVQISGSNAIVMRYPNVLNGEDFNSLEKTSEMNEINAKITDAVAAKFKAVYGKDIFVSADAELINATASRELITKSVLSVSIAMLLIAVYIMIRFDLFSGLAAIIGIVHDLLIMFSFVIIFKLQINSSLIACIITLVAYSINNTIIIFDMVRDLIKPFKVKKTKYDVGYVVNTAVGQTFTRSCYTSLTTLISLVVLASVGVPALTEFALPIIIGIVASMYSATFIVTSAWGLMIQSKFDNEGKKRTKKLKAKKSMARA